MAIGLGKMFGFKKLENFNSPYIANSITDFWRRWHISLSSWFKDYVYIPLGGNRKGKWRTILNLYIVFFITGLWHGASINFIFWGLGHGTLLFIEKTVGEKFDNIFPKGIVKTLLAHIYVLLSVMLLWVFFRLSVNDGIEFIKNLFSFHNLTTNPELSLLVDTRFYIYFIIGVSLIFLDKFRISIPNKNAILFKYTIKYSSLLCFLVLSICSLASSAYNPFIYFRF
jgi:alginate O-acetyltransferase complex protein AlgI